MVLINPPGPSAAIFCRFFPVLRTSVFYFLYNCLYIHSCVISSGAHTFFSSLSLCQRCPLIPLIINAEERADFLNIMRVHPSVTATPSAGLCANIEVALTFDV